MPTHFSKLNARKRKPRQTTGLQTLNLSTLSAFFLIEHVGFIFPNMYAKDLLNNSEHVNLLEFGGRGGSRTHTPFKANGFQDRIH
ncbi:hypothetical protein BIT33_05580 [Acinetobacter baumannii ATCC 19606 = CIP 70.34 = JCM 6841]|uniref:Uncharacterized protein n=1 Tax=Acinetobacter baumannii (strain ATCC 19606 / DSM 30007 / JCM 6841 / CCUG 19606 / CIP 70.34 / NBRC 109757 / NCIMB 12457 / NCTC 12156 / 81) TaxID=575584 RepID=D0CCC2_ACIB2|nr:hypothetical protein A4U85_05565 [Acinetobacter baumannii]EEX03360.1 hypothetical protein HMPREF0010_02402 [Acinetobacter baumannii ATCC 19606 = CIP 70.34 = JCM 6841]PJZ12096.1 hypothetical protein BIT33_05580 [Acinetobacter baumannii ATCC 19606 = CIP 70.34 = JCM 6841]